MTIQEAIKSGKPFKRKNWTEYAWLEVNGRGEVVGWMDEEYAKFDGNDLLATDWEVKP